MATIGLIIAGSVLMVAQYTQTSTDTQVTNQANLQLAQSAVNLAVQRALADGQAWLNAQNPRPSISRAGGGKYTYYNNSLPNVSAWSLNDWKANHHPSYQINTKSCGGVGSKALECYWIIEEISCSTTGSPANASYRISAYAHQDGFARTATKNFTIQNTTMGSTIPVDIYPKDLSSTSLCPSTITEQSLNEQKSTASQDPRKQQAASGGTVITVVPAYYKIKGQIFNQRDTDIAKNSFTINTTNSALVSGESGNITHIGVIIRPGYTNASKTLKVKKSIDSTWTDISASVVDGRAGSGDVCQFREYFTKQFVGNTYLYSGPLVWFRLPTPFPVNFGDTIQVEANIPGHRFASNVATSSFKNYTCNQALEKGTIQRIYYANGVLSSGIANQSLGVGSPFATCAEVSNPRDFTANMQDRSPGSGIGDPNHLFLTAKGTKNALTCP